MGKLYFKIKQSFNLSAICNFLRIVCSDPTLLLPKHESASIADIDWDHLKRRGIKGIIFDKDNTLTSAFEDKFIKDRIKDAAMKCHQV